MKIFCTLVWFCILSISSFAHEQVSKVRSTDLPLSFIKNNGQWESFIQYKTNIPGGAVFFTKEGFTYSLYSTSDLSRIHDLRLSGDRDIANEKNTRACL